MLESVSERLMETVHAGSPTKHPARRLATIEAAGELKIPFTSGILVGIGETEEERVESLEALASVARAPRPHPGGHPPELRPASAATTAPRWRTSRMRLRGGGGGGREDPSLEQQLWRFGRGHPPSPAAEAILRRARHAGVGEPVGDRGHQAADRGVQAADAGRRGAGAAEPVATAWPELVEAGATDLGGLSANGDHISPEQRVPEPAPGAQGAGAARGMR